ncbi:MAG: pyridoxine 5'-phosphate synthase [Proteobacteria bacterium]|nr:pyridoxine 5'-phosphate synthase [Pseudomonadota bacterium]
MTALSVNLNKIALLRNSRGRDYPNVVDFAKKIIALGVKGITVHPRQDERHTTRQDARDLAELIRNLPDVEFNIEGYPSKSFMELIDETRPDQCTLVPDGPDQITSDHGWDLETHQDLIFSLGKQLQHIGVRSSIFIDPVLSQIELAAQCQVDRVELYTEAYAKDFDTKNIQATLLMYQAAALKAQSLGLGVNAGHDLDLNNLSQFLLIPDILEVSIGHALTIEAIEFGITEVINRYLEICAKK